MSDITIRPARVDDFDQLFAEELGFEAVGRVPEAIKGEDAIVYWRRL